jgi:hypothetical protein
LRLFEREVTVPATNGHARLLSELEQAIDHQIPTDQIPVRFAMSESSNESYRCEVGLLEGVTSSSPSIFDMTRRSAENTSEFNAVLVVPTGIGAEIGGHAGDATPVARLLASVCGNLITHPNVVNASDLNELPDNGLYVEGSLLSRFLMGTIGLEKVRANRVLVVIDAHPNERFARATVNAVNAARATYGLRCPRVVILDPPLSVKGEYTESGRAAGTIDGLERLFDALDSHGGEYDAVALSTIVDVDVSHSDYFASRGQMVNPWGGAEAMLTHAVSTIYNVPSAHAPMMESDEIAKLDPGVVDPRMAAEVISLTFLQCVLKGLQRAPRVVTDSAEMASPSVLTARDVSCLVIPDGCVGLPTLAALEQGIPVIAVRENRNLMKNDLTMLPWAEDQLQIVDNYWEAVGVMAALKEGMSPTAVRRPFGDVAIDRATSEGELDASLPTSFAPNIER